MNNNSNADVKQVPVPFSPELPFFIRKTLALLIVKELKGDGSKLFAVVPRDTFKRQMESALGVPAWGRAASFGFLRSPSTSSVPWFCIILWKPSNAKKENGTHALLHFYNTAAMCSQYISASFQVNEKLRPRIAMVATASSSWASGIATFNSYFLFNRHFCSNTSKGYFKTA